MATVFISYRWDDAASDARSVCEALKARFPGANVYLDVDRPDPGSNFVRQFSAVVPVAEAMVVIIGPKWLQLTAPDGRRKLDHEDDYVRLELTGALAASEEGVLPVLVQNARMPAVDELPAQVKPLAHRTAVALRHDAWDAALDALTRKIEHLLRQRAIGGPAWRRTRRLGQALTWMAVIAGIVAATWLARHAWFNLIPWRVLPVTLVRHAWVLPLLMAPLVVALALQGHAMKRRAITRAHEGLFGLGAVAMNESGRFSLARLCTVWLPALGLLLLMRSVPPPAALSPVDESLDKYFRTGYLDANSTGETANYRVQRRSHYVLYLHVGWLNPKGEYTLRWRFRTGDRNGIELRHLLVDANYAPQMRLTMDAQEGSSTPEYVLTASLDALRAPRPIRLSGMYYIGNVKMEEIPLELSIEATGYGPITIPVSPPLDPRTWQ